MRPRSREPRPPALRRLVLRCAALALAVAVAGCGAATVPLDELVIEAEQYNGDDIVTHGIVAEFGEEDGAIERHFVLRDADENRVLLLPDDAVEAYVGSAVRVTGAFQYDPTRGRSLHVDQIEPATP